jgi:DNA-binding transcriptional ArsR family regulator
MSPTTVSSIDYDSIPQELKDRPQCAVWKREVRDGKPTKMPYQAKRPKAKAKSDDSSTWATFEEARATFERGGFDGIFYCMSKDDPYVGVDLDGVFDPETGQMQEDAARRIEALDSYTEISPSGTGVRIFLKGSLANLIGRKKGKVEVYDSVRFLSVTGNAYGPTRGIEERQAELEAFHLQVWPPRPPTPPRAPSAPTNADDKTVLERARANKTGDHFGRLWDGDLSDHPDGKGGYDHSAGDLALCNLLRFETGDAERVDELFRKSGLYREKKWNEVHFADGATYGEHTVEVAMDGEVRKSKSEKYKPQVYSDDTLKRTQAARATLPARMTATELMRLELEPGRHIVPGYLPVGLGILAARPKIGKSWLALMLAIAVASGGKALGRDVEQGDVLYLALEDNWRRLQDRLGQLLGQIGIAPERLDFLTQCRRLHEGGLDEILTWIDAHPDARLVVIDTWAKVEPPNAGRGADYAHITNVLGPLQRMALERDIAVMIVHHTKKPSKEGGDVFDQVLGTTAFVGIADTIMVMQRERMEADAVLAVTGRDIDEQQVAMSFDEETGLWTVIGNAEAMRIPPAQRQVLEAIDAGHTSPGKIAEHLRKGRTAVQNVLTKLLSKGLIATELMGGYKLTTALPGRGKIIVISSDTGDSSDRGDSSDSSDRADSDGGVSLGVTRVSPFSAASSDTPKGSSGTGKTTPEQGGVSPVSPVSPVLPKNGEDENADDDRDRFKL